MTTSTKTFSNKQASKPLCPSVKMKAENARKIGLFGAICVIVGSVIGIGAFIKNKSVFANNYGNPYGVLLSWGIAFIIAFATAFSYAEITRVKTRIANTGLAGWCERYVGYNFGRFLKITYPFFYYSCKLFIMSLILGELFFCINPFYNNNGTPEITNQNMWSIWGIGFGISLIMLIANWINNYAVTKSMTFITPIKFLPILLVVIFGVLGGVKTNGGLFNPTNFGPDQTYTGEFSITSVFSSLPAIMFAFDSFLVVGNVSENVNNPTRNIPISIIISMSICGIIYFLIAISQLLCGQPTSYGVFQEIFKNNETAKTTFTVTVSIFMAVSEFGVVTSISSAFINSTQAAINEEVIIGSRIMKKISNGSKNKLTGGFIMSLIIVTFWFIVLGVPSAVLNTDQIFDGFSNIIVVLFFTIYGFVVLMSIINRITNKIPQSEVPRQKGHVVFASISVLGCFLVPLYQMIYEFIYKVVLNPTGEYKPWGLFWGGSRIPTWIACLVFWFGVIIFVAFPFINDLLIKVTNKNYSQALMWQKVKVNKAIKVKK
ncbi:MAG: APC family permease [Mycoplasma sp.]|nr:APC family permease [Mycoplasma sp.]